VTLRKPHAHHCVTKLRNQIGLWHLIAAWSLFRPILATKSALISGTDVLVCRACAGPLPSAFLIQGLMEL
jgi:hypothetical protein